MLKMIGMDDNGTRKKGDKEQPTGDSASPFSPGLV
jgi:hypothetical protein